MIKKFDPPTVFELVERERVTRIHAVPAMIIALLNHPDFPKRDLSSVREVMMGGAPCNAALIREVEAKIPGCVAKGGYGLTETSPVLTIAHLKEHLSGEPEDARLRRKATAGYPLAGVELRVVNLEGRDVEPNAREIGEVIVRSDIVMAGYWNQPEETARAIRDGWFHTGDLAIVDEEGYVLIVDRSKDMILSGGENIASAEVERVLYEHPAVLECAVIPVPDDQWGEVPKAIVTLRAGQSAGEPELLAHCRKHLAGFKVPRSVEVVDALPKGGTGKVLKKVLREKYWAGRERRVN
jgi:acyl-CoA synthetase (AMP-forming)/AMP-acid ligase II